MIQREEKMKRKKRLIEKREVNVNKERTDSE